MKLNRRKAMAAITGGAVVAPRTIKSVMEAGNKFNPKPNYGIPAYDQIGGQVENAISKADAHKDYIKHRIEKLKRILSGQYDEWQQEQLNQEQLLEHRNMAEIENMKSLSLPGKYQLALSARRKLLKHEWKRQAEKELEQLLNPIKGKLSG